MTNSIGDDLFDKGTTLYLAYTLKEYLIERHAKSLKDHCGNLFSYEIDVPITKYIHQEEIKPSSLENYVDIKYLVKNAEVQLTEKFFLCRNLSPTLLVEDCMQFVVDDPTAVQAISVRLFNYSNSKLAGLYMIPVGAILIIKDPWLTMNIESGVKGYIVRVDNADNVMMITDDMLIRFFPTVVWRADVPTQYRHFSIGGGMLNTVEHWMSDGDEKMAKKNLTGAVTSYTTGLVIQPHNLTLLMKRATAYMSLRYFFRVLDDAKAIFTKDKNNFEAKMQYVRAFCGLKKYTDAFEFLEHIEVSSQQFDVLLNIIRKHQQQNDTGNFDFTELYMRRQMYNEDLSLADFNGPLQYTEGTNEIIRAKDDIASGQLLLVEHAFSITHTKRKIEDVERCNYMSSMNGDSDRKNCHTYRLEEDFANDLLASEITHKLTLEPEWRPYFYEWYCTEQADVSSVARDEIVDVSQKHSLNAWINEITGPVEGEYLTFVTGLWPSLARIRHSCWDANTFWIIIGNILILRSIKPIKKGEEILASFCDPPSELSMETRVAMKKTNHVCDCRLCESDRTAFKGTQEIYRRSLENFERNTANVHQMANCINLLKHLDPQEVNVALIRPCHQLAETYFKMGEYTEALNLYSIIYNLIQNSSLRYLVIEYSLRIALCFSRMGNESEERFFIKSAKSLSHRLYGVEDVWILIKKRLDKTEIVYESYNVTETKSGTRKLIAFVVFSLFFIFTIWIVIL